MTTPVDKYATAAVPRYTSYPTVPHFHGGFPAETYRQWLRALDPAEPLSLYLHIPFCRQLCWYCGCNMKLAARYEPVSAYVESLLREIALVADTLPARFKVSRLHFGGGTPTALIPDDLAKLMEGLRSRFDVTADAELAIESDPRTLTNTMAEMVGALGFTRVSLGIQEFDPRVQSAINRIQPFEMVESTVSRLRDAGLRGINFDLIYGLPHQTAEGLARTIRTCLTLRPDRLALYGYAHVPWMAKKQRLISEHSLPGPRARLEQAETAAREIMAANYVRVGLDHFALPEDSLARAAREGRLRRNFQGYTDDSAPVLIGLGATSIGRTPSGFIQNIAEPGAWGRAVDDGLLPVARGHAFTAEDRLRAHVIERLMCDGIADLAAAGALFDRSDAWWADALPDLRQLAADGLIALRGSELRVTESGSHFVRLAAACFDTYRCAAPARHSVAV